MKHHQNKKQVFGAIMVALAIVGSASLGVLADGEVITTSKTYQTDSFDAEYSNGYFPNFDNELTTKFAFGSGFTVSSTTRGTAHNHSKDENTYVDIYQGAHYNGRDLDMRIYTWASNGPYSITVAGGVIELSPQSETMTSIEQEYHFYEAGTLSSGPAQETSFKGIFVLSDVDIWDDERFSFPSGSAGIYLSSNTDIYFKEGAWGSHAEVTAAALKSWIWVEANSLTTNPLRVSYTTSKHSGQIREPGASTVTLNFPASDGKEAITHQVVQYGTFDTSEIEVSPSDSNLQLEGWYADSRYEIKYPEKFTVDGDVSLYAKYTEKSASTGPEPPIEDPDPGKILPDGPTDDEPSSIDPTPKDDSGNNSNNNPGSSSNSNIPNNDADVNTNTNTSSRNNASAGASSVNRATSTAAPQIAYATDDEDGIAVPATSAYVATDTTDTGYTQVARVYYPNTGHHTKQAEASKNVPVDILRAVLVAVGIIGLVQIISAHHRKLHF